MNKAFEQIFRVVKVIRRVPQPVYELSDLQNRSIEGQFYNYEVVKVTVSADTELEVDNIVRTRKNGGIKQHLVQWKGYDKRFNTWVKPSDIKNI